MTNSYWEDRQEFIEGQEQEALDAQTSQPESIEEAAATEVEEKPKEGFKFLPTDERAPEDIPKYEGELGRAVVGGAIDIYNSVGSIPKFFDKRFYKQGSAEDPYEYKAPWLVTKKPIMKTQWGSFIRSGVELVGGLIGTGKVMAGVNGLKGVVTASKATRLGRVGMAGFQGATYDLISNQSQEQNLARTLIDIKPQWSSFLDPIATNEDMTPFQRSVMNIGEGLGIGGLFDTALEAGGWALRTNSISAKKVGKKLDTNPLTKAIEDSSDADFKVKATVIEDGAKKAYEQALYRKLKRNNQVQVGIKAWRKSQEPWKQLPKEKKSELMQLFADKKGIDWGPYRDTARRADKQQIANTELAVEQLEIDLKRGKARENPAYYREGEVTDNQALSHSSQPVKGVRDMIEIRSNPEQKYGSPRGTLTEANIRRIEYAAPGTSIRERDALAKQLVAEPAYQKLYGKAAPDVITQDLITATSDLMRFINDSGHSRLIDVPETDVLSYIDDLKAGKETAIEGLGILNTEQLVATDVILGQLLYEARDLAKASLSVAEEVPVAADGSLVDSILARYAAVARLRKETSMLSSFNLARFKSGGKLKDSTELAEIRGKASDAAAEEINTFKQLLKSDPSDDLVESFIHFTATSNGNQQSWKDLQTFMKRKLHGYKQGDQYQRNAILNELAVMGVNSMLSGPKTPMRALAGTGLGTILRPAATVLGALNDDRTLRGAFASLGGMVDARNDAWRKAIAEWQSYMVKEEGFRGYTPSKGDNEWEGLKEFHFNYGTGGDKASMHIADSIRSINKLPFLNYGPRVMQSMDAYFTQMIGRGRLRQKAFDDVYTRLETANKVVSDDDMTELIKAAEWRFEGSVFDADGKVTDKMAKFAADEAKLTAELEGFAKDLDRTFNKLPFLRPFFLFARTGVNALKMTSKYTPILNRFIDEHVHIMTKTWDDPIMQKYGIESFQDLEIAKATMRGRVGIGYGVTATAALMALNGTITGNGPPDRQLRNSWIQAGWQPRSIKIGGKYVSYEALEPFNMFLSWTADVVDSQSVMGDEWVGNWFGKAAYMFSANVTNKSFLAGLLQLQDLFTSQGGDASRVAANFVNAQIPLSGLRNDIGKAFYPGMRELESGFWQSVGNRNLYLDVLGSGDMLPYRYDILNGEKIRDWDPITRIVNTVLPINLNVGTNTTREWLFRSGMQFRQTFNTGPDGQNLERHGHLKSEYQFYMGQQNIEAQLQKLFENPAIQESILKMENDVATGRKYEAVNTFHGPYVRKIFLDAKKQAWNLLEQNNPQAEVLNHLHTLEKLGNNARKGRKYEKDKYIQNEIEKFEKKMKVK